MRKLGFAAALLGLACSGVCVACSGGAEEVDTTLATVVPVRGTVRLGDAAVREVARAASGGRVRSEERSLSRVTLDLGPHLLLGASTDLSIVDATTIELGSGRVFVELRAGEQLELRGAGGAIRSADAAFSAELAGEALEVQVVRGEVSWTRGAQRGVAGSGQRVSFRGEEVAVEPARLWRDWTGGLARSEAGEGAQAAGLGVLEARVPDELGLARWPLVIRRLDVRVQVQSDLAITEVDQLFFNPASEAVEGLYRIEVPEGAVLQRFAVDRDGRLVDGYVRERAQAQRAYEAQVYRGSTEDPALLEWDAPGRYRARIYPIQAGETRRIVTRYAEWLRPPASGAPRLYRYPMGGGARAPHIQELSITADVSASGAERVRAGMGAQVERGAVRIRRSDFRPHADFWMELVGGEGTTQRAWTAEHAPPPRAPDARAIPNEADERDYFYLPLVLPADLAPTAQATGVDVAIVVDVSAATDRSHLELGRSVAEAIAAHLDASDRVAVVSSDLSIHSVVGDDAPALVEASPANVERLLDGLARASAGGATDLGQAFEQAAALLDPARPGAVVYVGDGAPTVGELRAEGLLDRMSRLPHPTRFYAIAVGGDANVELLEALTRGGGLALRVEERGQAAEAALRFFAHVERPVAHAVEVVLGDGIENAFPRRPMDAVLGEVFPVVGRVRSAAPSSVTVRGTIAGRRFERTVAIESASTDETTDLRLRWAAERLRQLMLEGAGREEVAELGTRYGLITPFTSYYVPSRNELARMGPSAALWVDQPLLEAGSASDDRAMQNALAIFLGPLGIAGCTSEDAPSAVAPPPSDPASAAMQEAELERAEQASARLAEESRTIATGAEGAAGGMPAGAYAAPSAPPPAQAAMDVPAPAAAPAPTTPSEPQAAAAAEVTALEERAQAGAADEASREALDALLGDQIGHTGGAIGVGSIGRIGTGEGGGGAAEEGAMGQTAAPSSRMAAGPRPAPPRDGYARPSGGRERNDLADERGPRRGRGGEEDARAEGERLAWNDGARPGRDEAPEQGAPDAAGAQTAAQHQARRCSDAANLSLADRIALWRERLAGDGPSSWVQVYEEAIRRCEARDWRDRRTLLGLVLDRAGSVDAMLAVHRLLGAYAARAYVRAQVFRRVRSPEDLRRVRAAFGLGTAIDWSLVEQILARAPDAAARIRALRRLVLEYPESFDLKLRLLAALEQSERLDEAKRLARRMRADPSADPGVRTAVGEMYLRLGLEADARRAFSEIVEFAPLDELARRRLGDLYRAHGWHEDAYRQYQTLTEIRPDDPTARLLLAQAAAGAGRIDEALRLEQGLMQTAEAGASEGIARTALLWSSVRFARLRKAAREANDAARLEALSQRLRRSGVLREARALRVTLVWSHPDAQLALWAAHPGMTPTRPTDITPELGLEAFDLEEQEPGEYTFEVRRTPDPNGVRTTVDAQLVLVWNEGRDDEKVEVLDLRFDGARASYAWTLTGRTLAERSIPSQVVPSQATAGSSGSPTPPSGPASTPAPRPATTPARTGGGR